MCAVAWGDTVTLKNGDRLTGTVGQIAGGKMEFTSPVLGKLTIDMANVASFTTESPVTVRLKSPPAVQHATGGTSQEVTSTEGKAIPLSEVKVVNPPPQKWTGSILVNGQLARGNTNTAEVGVTGNATLRRYDEMHNDRFSLAGEYNYGNSGRGDTAITNTDNWMASGKYDRFLNDQLYAYGNLQYDHDRIAGVDYRLVPGVGLGYQWVERPTLNFSTEAGFSYMFQHYDTGGSNDYASLRLAYHFDTKLIESLSLFHNLEWLPAIDDPSDYNLITDLGLRAPLTKAMFSEFRVEYKRDSVPAPGAMKNDLRYLAGVGWSF